jgi:hypothetical protein
MSTHGISSSRTSSSRSRGSKSIMVADYEKALNGRQFTMGSRQVVSGRVRWCGRLLSASAWSCAQRSQMSFAVFRQRFERPSCVRLRACSVGLRASVWGAREFD